METVRVKKWIYKILPIRVLLILSFAYAFVGVVLIPNIEYMKRRLKQI